MPSISKILAITAFLLSPMVTASPLDPATHSLAKRATWTFGTSKCPANDNDIYNGPSGVPWLIRCGKDTADGGDNMPNGPGNVSFQQCILACGARSGCVRVTFIGDVQGEQGPCYLKSSKASALVSVSGHKVATKNR